MRKVHIVGTDHLVENMFAIREGYKVVSDMGSADIVVFTGGADVTPELYGAIKHNTTSVDTRCDLREIGVYQRVKPHQLVVGICRGSQFLCVVNGGTLYQDVDRHGINGTHACYYRNAKGQVEEYQVTSTHHQMQNPFQPQEGKALNFELWGWAQRTTYRTALPACDAVHEDVEIVYWPDTRSLGFQGHPEYGSTECRNLFFICLDRAFDLK